MPLAVGTYTDATRYPFNSQASSGLSWHGEGRGCNTLRGSFSIDSLTYTDGALASMDLRFEQRCEGGDAHEGGELHERSLGRAHG